MPERDNAIARLRTPPQYVGGWSGETRVLLTEAVEGGWGLAGHAHTNAELVEAARAEIAELSSTQADGN